MTMVYDDNRWQWCMMKVDDDDVWWQYMTYDDNRWRWCMMTIDDIMMMHDDNRSHYLSLTFAACQSDFFGRQFWHLYHRWGLWCETVQCLWVIRRDAESDGVTFGNIWELSLGKVSIEKVVCKYNITSLNNVKVSFSFSRSLHLWIDSWYV